MSFQGGPTREFLSEVWNQLGHLGHFDEETGLKHEMFISTGDFLAPQGNNHLVNDKDTHAYFRAVGRILLYCLGQKISIASHVLVSLHGLVVFPWVTNCSPHVVIWPQPDLYKFYLLRDISPLDIEYPISDLVIHVFDLLSLSASIGEHDSIDSGMKTVLQQFLAEKDCADTQTQFRQMFFEHFIENRSFALDALKEGITLNGKSLLKADAFFGVSLRILHFLAT